MLQEIIEALQIEKGKKYIDCNLGDGGHSLEILKGGGSVLGIDLDKNSIDRAAERIDSLRLKNGFIAVQGNFKDIDSVAKDKGFSQVDGVLFDLGYSSSQLDDTELGLSFLSDAPLDMRMDKSLSVTAADLLNALPEQALSQLFWEFGEERLAKRYAKEIVKVRSLKKLQRSRKKMK